MDRTSLPGVAALERQCFSDPWSTQMLEEELYNPCACFIVAVDENDNVLGYAGLHVAADEGYIDNIAVTADHRKEGIGTALLNTFMAFGREHLRFLTLEVRASNEEAISFYRSRGFREVGRRENYYRNPQEDALLMTVFFSEEGEEET